METLYTYHEASVNQNSLACSLHIDPEHPIFKGHFPDKPLLPGVCMIQMMIETISNELNHHFELKSATMIKFIKMWLPEMHLQADLNMSYEFVNEKELKVKNCIISADSVPFFKFKGLLNAV